MENLTKPYTKIYIDENLKKPEISKICAALADRDDIDHIVIRSGVDGVGYSTAYEKVITDIYNPRIT